MLKRVEVLCGLALDPFVHEVLVHRPSKEKRPGGCTVEALSFLPASMWYCATCFLGSAERGVSPAAVLRGDADEVHRRLCRTFEPAFERAVREGAVPYLATRIRIFDHELLDLLVAHHAAPIPFCWGRRLFDLEGDFPISRTE